MSASQPLAQRHRSREWLAGIAIIYGGLLFIVPTILRAAAPVTHLPGAVQQPLTNWSMLWSFALLQGVLFSSVLSYLIVSAVGVILIAAGLIGAPRGKLTVVLLFITLAGILVYPFLNVYQPALTAAPGYEMRVATQPDLLDGVVKSAHKTMEMTPCEYTLLGWSTPDRLYYAEQCNNGNSRTWLYDVSLNRSQAVIAPPRRYATNTCGDVTLSDWVRAPSVYPAAAEPSVRQVYLQGNSLSAPNCEWVAAIARHGYGPEDVILLREVT